MTRRLWLLSSLVYLLVLFAFIIRRGELAALAFLPLVMIFSAIFQGMLSGEKLSAVRGLSAQKVSPGRAVTVRLEVFNEGNQVLRVAIVDPARAQFLTVEGETEALTMLDAGKSITLEYQVTGKRGLVKFPDVEATVEDAFGLFKRIVYLRAPASLTILPKVDKLRSVPMAPARTQIYAGLIPAKLSGSGINFFGVRPYRPGDPQRWINWKKTARYEESFYITEFEQERIADVGLVLDARDLTEVTGRDDTLFEHSVQAVASLADSFLRYGNRVGLMVYGRGTEATFPGYGKYQRERILRSLAYAKTGENMVLVNLGYLPTRFFPAKSQIVLVSPLAMDDIEPLVRLRANGYNVMVISPDPIAYETAMYSPGRERELAHRIARLERIILLRQVREAGIPVVDWDVQTPLDTAIQTTLGRGGIRGQPRAALQGNNSNGGRQ